MLTEHELLEKLAGFINQHTFIVGDENSVSDMVKRYKYPPLTMHYRVSMRLTVPEFNYLNDLMRKVNEAVKTERSMVE